MRKILLDTNVIIRHPKLFGLQIPDTSLVVTSAVFNELMVRTAVRGVNEEWVFILQNALNEKTVEKLDNNEPSVRLFNSQLLFEDVDKGDISLIVGGLYLKSQGNEVIIATFDKGVREHAQALGMDVFGEQDLRLLLTSYWATSTTNKKGKVNETEQTPVEPTAAQEKIIHFERRERNESFRSLFIGLVSSILTAVILKSETYKLLPGVKVWGTIAIILAGFVLFYWRERNILSYGIFELFGGIAAILIVLYPLSFDFGLLYVDVEKDFKVLGGIYIMVRGLDNIVNGLYGSKTGVWLYQTFKIGKES